MKFEWKIPHDFYPRLAQALVTAGSAGLLYAGAYNSTEAYTPAMQSLTAESGYIAEDQKADTSKNTEPETKNSSKIQAGTESENSGNSRITGDTESENPGNSRITGDTESENPENSKITAAAEPDTGETTSVSDAQTTEVSDTEHISMTKDSTDGLIETEISDFGLKIKTADSEDETESSVIVEYAVNAPLADPENPLSVIQDELTSLFQLQPNYLDLTNISLSWEHLEEELTSLTESYSGDWSVYVKNLSNGEVININQHPMESASLIKLFIMGAVMEQIHSGELERTDKIDSLLHEMITVSDNEAANELVRYLSRDHDHKDGLTYLNDFAKRCGFDDTQQVNGLEDASLRHNPSEINRTSARDCGELLARIYDGTLVSHLLSRKMEDLLLAQEITYKIPSALPDEAISASKTGEVSDAENDSAIIYSPGGDFVLCIMSGGWSSGNQAITHIREITKLVYNHFNPQEAE